MTSIVLHRDGPVRYHFEADGVDYVVTRTTDGTLSSAVNWAVFSVAEDGYHHHEGDFGTLADIRSYPWSNADDDGTT